MEKEEGGERNRGDGRKEKVLKYPLHLLCFYPRNSSDQISDPKSPARQLRAAASRETGICQLQNQNGQKKKKSSLRAATMA